MSYIQLEVSQLFNSHFCYFLLEADVESYFTRFGEVADVAVMREKSTGRSRGFAFVTFRERS